MSAKVTSHQPRPRRAFTRIEDMRSLLAEIWSGSPERSTVFAGAGISVPPPSGLPTAHDVIRGVIRALTAHPSADSYRDGLLEVVQAANLKMEVLFEIVERSASANLLTLFEVFAGANPNLYHHLLARLLQAGSIDHIVTANFDSLIEKTFDGELAVFSAESEHENRARPAVYKIHGTVERPETVIAVLKQVSRGLGPSKRKLLQETLGRTCIVLGWSDDDVDLTPVFFESRCELLIWFLYHPGTTTITDFTTAASPPSNLPPKIEKLLREKSGIVISCDPLQFLLDVWSDIENHLGQIPTLQSAPPRDLTSVFSKWSDSLTVFERLLIVSDIFRHVTEWERAAQLLKQAETEARTPDQFFNVHYRLGLCFTNLSRWRAAFDSFDACIADKGYQGTIERLLADRPIDPSLAVVYGNLAALFGHVGRIHDAVACHEVDASLCERFFRADRGSAYANLAVSLSQLGDWTGARTAAEKAAAYGSEEGDLLSVAISHQALANCAAASGDWRNAQLELEAANAIADLLSRPDFQVECIKSLAQIAYTVGDVQRSLDYVERALNIAGRHDLTDLQAELWMIIGVTLKESASMSYRLDSVSQSPELRNSLAAYETSLGFLAKKDTNQKLKSIILNNRGLLFHLLGNNSRALQDLWESLTIRTRVLDEIGKATILNNLALVLMGTDEAEEFLLEALAIYDRFGHKLGRCQVIHDLAGVHMTRLSRFNKLRVVKRRREYTKALKCLRESLKLAEELQAPVKIKQARHNLAVLESLYHS